MSEPLSAEDLDRVRRRVVNVVGHELRTPITTARGLAELLADASLEEIRATIGPALVRTLSRSEELLDDLLVAGEISTAVPVTDTEPVDVSEVVTSVVGRAGASFEVELPPEPVVVNGHHRTIAGAIEHLVDNAARYGTGARSIKVSPSDSGAVTVVVRSTGTPITPGDLDVAFELFYRGEHAVTSTAGLGIGLPVARGLARQLGGDVTVEADGDAVVATLTLPERPRG